METLVSGHRLRPLHELHAVLDVLPVRRLRSGRRQPDQGPAAGQLQDRLPGLLTGLPGSSDSLPQIQERADQRRRRARRGPEAGGDEGRHLRAAGRRHLRGTQGSQRKGPRTVLHRARRVQGSAGAQAVSEEAAKEIAKMIPYAILAFFLTSAAVYQDPNFFTEKDIGSIPSKFIENLEGIVFAVVVVSIFEYSFRIGFLIKRKIWPVSEKILEEEIGKEVVGITKAHFKKIEDKEKELAKKLEEDFNELKKLKEEQKKLFDQLKEKHEQ